MPSYVNFETFNAYVGGWGESSPPPHRDHPMNLVKKAIPPKSLIPPMLKKYFYFIQGKIVGRFF